MPKPRRKRNMAEALPKFLRGFLPHTLTDTACFVWGGPMLTPLSAAEESAAEGDTAPRPEQSFVLLPPTGENWRNLPLYMQELANTPIPPAPAYCVVVARHLALSSAEKAVDYAEQLLQCEECSRSGLAIVVYGAHATRAAAACRLPQSAADDCMQYSAALSTHMPAEVAQRLAAATTATDVEQLICAWAAALSL